MKNWIIRIFILVIHSCPYIFFAIYGDLAIAMVLFQLVIIVSIKDWAITKILD